MATFTFNCPQCGNLLSGEDEWRGMETECPECKKHIVVPIEEKPLLVKPHHPNNILPKASTANPTVPTFKKTSRFDHKVLRITKIVLFATSCYFFAIATAGFNETVTRPSTFSTVGKNEYGDSSYKLKSEYEVSVADSTYATYKNTVSIAENTKDIQSGG